MARTNLPNVGYPFISFKIFDKNLSWSANDNRPDYFMSLSHQRYADKANTATVTLEYAPRYGQDPNMIERALSVSGGLCQYQYGIAGYRSKVYQGMIYDYKTAFQEGSLSYTLSLVSSSVSTNFNSVDDGSLSIKTPSDQDYYNDIIKNKVYADLGEDVDPRGGSAYAAYLRQEGYQESVTVVDYVLDIMSAIVERYCEGYVFNKEKSDKDFQINTQVTTLGLSPIEALKKIASNLSCSSNVDSNFYKIIVDDQVTSSGKCEIYLKKISCKGSVDIVYTFDWNHMNGDVISWNPRYSGYAAIFTNRNNLANNSKPSDATVEEDEEYAGNNQASTLADSSRKVSTIDIKDGIPTVESYDYPPQVIKQNAASLEAFWQQGWNSRTLAATATEAALGFMEAVNYPYLATIEVLGTSDIEVNLISTYIQVNPYVNGQLHHSAGIYQVIGITDQIDSRGFITKLELVKHVESDTTDQVSADDAEENSSSVTDPRPDGFIGGGPRMNVQEYR